MTSFEMPQVLVTTATAPTAGTCQVDTYVISTTQGRDKYPTLCGLQTGQHQYIDAGHTSNPTDQVTLTFQLNAGGTAVANDRFWNIKVTQIPCNTVREMQ